MAEAYHAPGRGTTHAEGDLEDKTWHALFQGSPFHKDAASTERQEEQHQAGAEDHDLQWVGLGNQQRVPRVPKRIATK